MSATGMILGAQQTATIQRNTPTKDSQGGNVSAWSNYLLDVPVSEHKAGGDEVARYERETNRKRSVWYAPSGSDIRARDRMIVGSRTLNIINTDDRQYGGRAHIAHTRIEAEETN